MPRLSRLLFKSSEISNDGALGKPLADADLVQIVLKGKKAEKPPNMPGYEEKGITEDQAKALVAYIKRSKLSFCEG